MLISNIIMRGCISLFIYLLLILHIHNLIASDNKRFTFLKDILSGRFYLYVIRAINIESKTN